jgi:hypothetical protein
MKIQRLLRKQKMRKVDQIVEDRKEELEKYTNVILEGTQLKQIGAKVFSRRMRVQLFIDDEGNIVLARGLDE